MWALQCTACMRAYATAAHRTPGGDLCESSAGGRAHTGPESMRQTEHSQVIKWFRKCTAVSASTHGRYQCRLGRHALAVFSSADHDTSGTTCSSGRCSGRDTCDVMRRPSCTFVKHSSILQTLIRAHWPRDRPRCYVGSSRRPKFAIVPLQENRSRK